MKCTYCGGEVSAAATKCPYCNNLNPVGADFQNELRQKADDNQTLEQTVMQDNKDRMLHKILTRTLFVLLILLLVNITGSFLTYEFLSGNSTLPRMKKTDLKIMEAYAAEEDYNRLECYVDSRNLFGEYDTYDQMVTLNRDYRYFIEYRNDCINRMDAGLLPEEFELSRVIQRAADILERDTGFEAADLQEAQRESVLAFFKDYLNFTVTELAALQQEKFNAEDAEALAASYLQRNAGGTDHEE